MEFSELVSQHLGYNEADVSAIVRLAEVWPQVEPGLSVILRIREQLLINDAYTRSSDVAFARCRGRAEEVHSLLETLRHQMTAANRLRLLYESGELQFEGDNQ